MKHKLESRLQGEVSITSDMQIDSILMAEEEIKNLLMNMKEDSEKTGLKLTFNNDHGIRSHHFMANGWANNGNSDRLYFLGFQKSLQTVTAAMK